MIFEIEDFPAVLFNRYDMQVEFDHRIAKARADVERLQRLYPLYSKADVAKAELSWSWIDPLELRHEEAVLHELGPLGECDSKPLFCFVKQIPYLGDELWDLSPCNLEDPPEGAIYRGYLMMQGEGHGKAEALEKIEGELAKVEAVMEEQRSRIKKFHQELPSLIRDAVHQAYLKMTVH